MILTVNIILTKHKHCANIVIMFPEQYKHPSKVQKNLFSRMASKVTGAFKNKQPVESVSTWIV